MKKKSKLERKEHRAQVASPAKVASPSYRKWTLLTCGCSGLLLLAIALFNLLADPFGIYEIITVNGFNALKVGVNDHVRMTKTHVANRLKPRTIILGTSRTEYAINPEHPCFQEQAKPVYNLALPGGSIYEIQRYLEFAQAVAPLKTAVIGLDFMSFRANTGLSPDFSENRLNGPLHLLQEKLDLLLLLDTTVASFDVVTTQQINYKKDYYQSNGLRGITSRIGRISGWGQQGWFFNIHNQFGAGTYGAETAKEYDFFAADAREKVFTPFRNIIKFAYTHNIDLRFFISPENSVLLEVLHQNGLWKSYEEWKRLMTKALAEEAGDAKRAPFPLWDFAAYGPFNNELPPMSNPKKLAMQWYYDPSHYSLKLGDLVLDRIFGRPMTVNGAAVEGFGVLLSEENIESHLVDIQSQRRAYAETANAYMNTLQKGRSQGRR